MSPRIDLPPISFPFPDPPILINQVPANYHCANAQIQQKLASYLKSSGLESSISSEIYKIAVQQGIKVTVLTNEEYDKRYPGSGGVTVGPSDAREVFLPERSIENPADTSLEHELVHAYVETDSSPGSTLYKTAVNSSLPKWERQAAAEQLFQNLGGSKAQGRAWEDGLDGIPQDVRDATGDHMLNSATDRLIYRQKAGQTLDTPETLTVMRNAAKGEAAMHLLSQLQPDKNGNKPSFWTIASVYLALHSMYGDKAPDYRGGSIDDVRTQMSSFLKTTINAFDGTRNAYATNR